MTIDKTPSPTDAEAWALWTSLPLTGSAIQSQGEFARAVLAKWGSPVVAGEPVAWYEYNADLDAWFLAYSHNPKAKTRPLVFGDTTPQPTRAQAVAVDDAALIQQLVAAINDMRLAAAYTTYGAPNWDDLEPALAAARARLKEIAP